MAGGCGCRDRGGGGSTPSPVLATGSVYASAPLSVGSGGMWVRVGLGALSVLGLDKIFTTWFSKSTGGSKQELEVSLAGIGKAAAGFAAVTAVALAAVMTARKGRR